MARASFFSSGLSAAFLFVAACATPEGDEWSIYDSRWWSESATERLQLEVESGFPDINTVPPPPPSGTYKALLNQLREGYKDTEKQPENRTENRPENHNE